MFFFFLNHIWKPSKVKVTGLKKEKNKQNKTECKFVACMQLIWMWLLFPKYTFRKLLLNKNHYFLITIPITAQCCPKPPLVLQTSGVKHIATVECFKTQHCKYSSGVFSESRGISGHGAPLACFRLPTAWDSTTMSLMLYHLSKLQEMNKQ